MTAGIPCAQSDLSFFFHERYFDLMGLFQKLRHSVKEFITCLRVLICLPFCSQLWAYITVIILHKLHNTARHCTTLNNIAQH
jgi:hypothetical protein